MSTFPPPSSSATGQSSPSSTGASTSGNPAPPARIASLAQAPLLVVACDFDGTVAPIVKDPAAAAMDRRCRAALEALGRLPCTSVAVISGRSLEWLRGATHGLPDPLLFGSHGAEPLARERPAPRVNKLTVRLKNLVPRWPGVHVEEKPYGAAVHYRRANGSVADELHDAARAIASEFVGVVVKLGSMVVELTTSAADKGDALRAAKVRAGATHALFIGDDITDEDAFRVLTDQDLGIKVGEGPTAADYAVAGVEQVADTLEELLAARCAELESRRPVALQAHSVLSDFRTVAVIGPTTDVAWLCLPRIDSPALFAGLLGGTSGFSVRPETPSGRRSSRTSPARCCWRRAGRR
ncbi:MAG: trehalose-phosphatase [Phycisphaerales bacterium]